MLKWIKRNWRQLTVLAAGIIAIVTITLVILHTQKDRAWITKDKDGKPLPCGHVRWDANAIPIPVYLEATSDAWVKEAAAAIVFWNEGTGVELFRAAGVLDPLFAEQPNGSIFVEAIGDGSLESHGLTDWKATDGPDYCRALSMRIRLPGLLMDKESRRKATAHEFGHALGLDHDDMEQSVMHPGGRVLAWGLNEITNDDRDRLRVAYGRR